MHDDTAIYRTQRSHHPILSNEINAPWTHMKRPNVIFPAAMPTIRVGITAEISTISDSATNSGVNRLERKILNRGTGRVSSTIK